MLRNNIEPAKRDIFKWWWLIVGLAIVAFILAPMLGGCEMLDHIRDRQGN